MKMGTYIRLRFVIFQCDFCQWVSLALGFIHLMSESDRVGEFSCRLAERSASQLFRVNSFMRKMDFDRYGELNSRATVYINSVKGEISVIGNFKNFLSYMHRESHQTCIVLRAMYKRVEYKNHRQVLVEKTGFYPARKVFKSLGVYTIIENEFAVMPTFSFGSMLNRLVSIGKGWHGL